jgi:hypothetical protein
VSVEELMAVLDNFDHTPGFVLDGENFDILQYDVPYIKND